MGLPSGSAPAIAPLESPWDWAEGLLLLPLELQLQEGFLQSWQPRRWRFPPALTERFSAACANSMAFNGVLFVDGAMFAAMSVRMVTCCVPVISGKTFVHGEVASWLRLC